MHCAARILMTCVFAAALSVGSAAADDFGELRKAYTERFKPLPVRRMFSDLDEELRLGRRDPYSKGSRDERTTYRADLKLRRAQLRTLRKDRERIAQALADTGTPPAAALLMKAYDRLLADVALARENLDRHAEAGRTDINPGVDPGGIYWKNWVRLTEMGAARGVLADEVKLRDMILGLLVGLRTPEAREWLRKNAAAHKQIEVRDQTLQAIAKSKDPTAAVLLRAILASEKQPWGRAMILSALGAGKPAGAGAVVLGALKDPVPSVRAAAIRASIALDLRDAAAVGAFIAALEQETGRLRLDLRFALVRATGEALPPAGAAWRIWWDDNKAAWKPPAKAATVAAPEGKGFWRCFGIPTTSKRIAFVVSRAQLMADPATRRATDNAGKPSPKPKVDTSLRIAAWEVGEAVRSLPEDAEFTVLVYGEELTFWLKRPKKASDAAAARVAKWLSRFHPGGGSRLAPALAAVLKIGQSKKLEDLALGTLDGVDTIFVVGTVHDTPGSLGSPERSGSAIARMARLRGVRVHALTVGSGSLNLSRAASATGGTVKSIKGL